MNGLRCRARPARRLRQQAACAKTHQDDDEARGILQRPVDGHQEHDGDDDQEDERGGRQREPGGRERRSDAVRRRTRNKPPAASAMNPSVVHMKNATICWNLPMLVNTVARIASRIVARTGERVTGWTAAIAGGKRRSRRGHRRHLRDRAGRCLSWTAESRHFRNRGDAEHVESGLQAGLEPPARLTTQPR